jgi:hypothetical protein
MRYNYFMLVFGSLFGLFSLAACQKDACKNSSCDNQGVCEDGKCLCQLGYQGEKCETLWASKFQGNKYVNEMNCNRQYYADITLDNDTAYLLKIRNLGGYVSATACPNYTVNARLISANEFEIDDTFCTNYTMRGVGRYDPILNRLSIEYSCVTPTHTDICVATIDY